MTKRPAVAAGGTYLEALRVDRRGLDVRVGERVVILSATMARRTGPGIVPEVVGVVLEDLGAAVLVEFEEEVLAPGLPRWWRFERWQIVRKA